jgi:uracil-DNA glycosylase family 4
MADGEALRRQYLQALGVQLWERRSVATPAVTPPEPAAADVGETAGTRDNTGAGGVGRTTVRLPIGNPALAAMDWKSLEAAVCGCVACTLHNSRTQTVFGVGDRRAQWMFIGEAPGEQEDLQGQPFVGRAGQLLNAMLAAIGFEREQVYIANVLKCRPPNNRDPQIEEIARCEPYLLRQIELVGPRIIIALGRHAAHSLLKTEMPLNKLRGRRLNYHGIPLVVTYHPAYLLRNPVDKRKVWDDLCLARAVVERA